MLINKEQLQSRINYRKEALKEELSKLEERFELLQASVFSITVLQEKIVARRFLAELEDFENHIDDYLTSEALAEYSDRLARQYFREAFRVAGQSFMKASQEFEESSRLENSKLMFSFFREYCSDELQEAQRLLGIYRI